MGKCRHNKVSIRGNGDVGCDDCGDEWVLRCHCDGKGVFVEDGKALICNPCWDTAVKRHNEKIQREIERMEDDCCDCEPTKACEDCPCKSEPQKFRCIKGAKFGKVETFYNPTIGQGGLVFDDYIGKNQNVWERIYD